MIYLHNYGIFVYIHILLGNANVYYTIFIMGICTLFEYWD